MNNKTKTKHTVSQTVNNKIKTKHTVSQTGQFINKTKVLGVIYCDEMRIVHILRLNCTETEEY